jgi:Cyclin, N-terminal domain
MNIEESLIQHLKSTSKETNKDAIKIIEEPVAQFPIEQKSTNVVTYSSLPPTSNIPNINSGYTPNYNSNPVSSGNSSNAQNSNQKNSIPENPNKKSSTGKSSNPISNNSSYMKSKGRKSSHTHKTESTCISGEDSPPVLDCDEIINNNFGTVSNNKVENNCFWVEKFDPEPKSSDSLEADEKRGILRDITDAIMKADSIQEELANFNPDNSSCAIDSDTITYLVSREIDYSPDSHYFDKKQNQVTWIMRAILFDWMMEVCMEFTLKRETFHYSVNYVDRYLSSVQNIQKWELQLVGVTAMYIASKVEVK